MPVMDGFESAKSILNFLKEVDDEDYCHIVALTSYTSKETYQRAIEIGMKNVIHKPIESSELEKVVQKHFHR